MRISVRTEKVKSSTAFPVAVYIGAVLAAEAFMAFGATGVAFVLHAVLVSTLLTHATLLRSSPDASTAARGDADGAERRPRASADAFAVLSLIPLARILGMALPVEDVGEVYRPAVAGAPLLLAVVLAARFTNPSTVVTLVGRPSWSDAAIAACGVPLGLAAFLIARPDALVSAADWRAVAVAVPILVLFTAFLEEVIFRGLLQNALTTLFGRPGVLWASLVYAGVYLGARPPAYFAFVAVLGLAFALLVERRRSLFGVALAHAFVNVGMVVVWPWIFT